MHISAIMDGPEVVRAEYLTDARPYIMAVQQQDADGEPVLEFDFYEHDEEIFLFGGYLSVDEVADLILRLRTAMQQHPAVHTTAFDCEWFTIRCDLFYLAETHGITRGFYITRRETLDSPEPTTAASTATTHYLFTSPDAAWETILSQLEQALDRIRDEARQVTHLMRAPRVGDWIEINDEYPDEHEIGRRGTIIDIRDEGMFPFEMRPDAADDDTLDFLLFRHEFTILGRSPLADALELAEAQAADRASLMDEQMDEQQEDDPAAALPPLLTAWEQAARAFVGLPPYTPTTNPGHLEFSLVTRSQEPMMLEVQAQVPLFEGETTHSISERVATFVKERIEHLWPQSADKPATAPVESQTEPEEEPEDEPEAESVEAEIAVVDGTADRLTVGDRVRVVKMREYLGATLQNYVGREGVVDVVDPDDAILPYCVRLDERLVFWARAEEVVKLEPETPPTPPRRPQVGDRVRVTNEDDDEYDREGVIEEDDGAVIWPLRVRFADTGSVHDWAWFDLKDLEVVAEAAEPDDAPDDALGDEPGDEPGDELATWDWDEFAGQVDPEPSEVHGYYFAAPLAGIAGIEADEGQHAVDAADGDGDGDADALSNTYLGALTALQAKLHEILDQFYPTLLAASENMGQQLIAQGEEILRYAAEARKQLADG